MKIARVAVIGTAGPWLEPTGWPATWWNLNVQLEYWLLPATGHDELGRAVAHHGTQLGEARGVGGVAPTYG